MSIVGVISMKGGVGKTSVTANLAASLGAQLGAERVFAVDLDPQNGLHWHFGLCDQEESGVCTLSLQGGNWRDAFLESEFDVACLPYGIVTEPDRESFEQGLSTSGHWTGEQLGRAGLTDGAVVLLDSPPGPSVYLKQVFDCADLILVVLLADAGSYATIPDMETWLDDYAALRPGLKVFYILNQVDRSEALNRDTTAFLRQQLRHRLCPIDIHTSEEVAEALAFQQPVRNYDPQGQASDDFSKLATWVISTLKK